jgi:hypothetical protein
MGLDLKKVRENYEKKTSEKGSFDRWKPTAGGNPVRVIPHTLKYFTEPVSEIAFTYFMHYSIGPEGSKSSVVCPKSFNRKNVCPICEAVAQLQKTGDPNDASLAADMGMRRRYILNIIDLKSAETVAKGIQPYECGPTVYNDTIKWINEKWGDPLDLEKGRNFTVTMTVPASGNKKRTEYSVEPDPQPSSIMDSLPQNWKEQVKKLETLMPKVVPYDTIKKMLEGEVDYGTAGEENGEEAPHVGMAKEAVKVTAQATAQMTPAPAQVQGGAGTGPVPAAPGGKPKCYGQLYSTKSEKCIACGVNDPCKAEFLKE